MVTTISNHETLMGTMTHQGLRKIMVPTWHDVDYEWLFFLNSYNVQALQQIR
jgi:hypothetical protein